MNIYPYKSILKDHHKYCVYLTIYRGKKLPPFYIGSTYIDNIRKNNYHGSVTSKKYKEIYNKELKDNPDLFKTIILRSTLTRKFAAVIEFYLQKKNKAVGNNFFINMGYAAPGNFYSWNEGIRGNDYLAFFSEEGLKNSKEVWIKKGEVSAKDIRTGKKVRVSKEDFDKYDYYVGHTKGAKQSQETRDKVSKGNLGKKRSKESKKNYSKMALNRPYFNCRYCGNKYKGKGALTLHEKVCKNK